MEKNDKSLRKQQENKKVDSTLSYFTVLACSLKRILLYLIQFYFTLLYSTVFYFCYGCFSVNTGNRDVDLKCRH